MSKRLKESQERIKQLSANSVENRIAYTILKLGEKLGVENDLGLLIQIPLTRYDIAGMTGTTPETASRIISKFKEVGLIKTGRKWTVITNISELEKKLYSGKVTNPKELTGLQQDAESLKTRRKEKEDRALEIMEQREAASVGVRERQVYLTGVEEAWRTEQAALEKEAGELALRIESLERQRQEFRAGLEAGLVEQYDKLKAQKGSAVAGVEQGICRGCRISLSQAQLRQVRTGALARCGNCGRILYLA